MKEEFFVSKQMLDMIKGLPESKPFYGGYNLPIRESSLFPFEIMYDACDVETKLEIKIPSGEWIHGVAIPAEEWKIDTPLFDNFKEKADLIFNNWFAFKSTETSP